MSLIHSKEAWLLWHRFKVGIKAEAIHYLLRFWLLHILAWFWTWVVSEFYKTLEMWWTAVGSWIWRFCVWGCPWSIISLSVRVWSFGNFSKAARSQLAAFTCFTKFSWPCWVGVGFALRRLAGELIEDWDKDLLPGQDAFPGSGYLAAILHFCCLWDWFFLQASMSLLDLLGLIKLAPGAGWNVFCFCFYPFWWNWKISRNLEN